MKTTLIFLGVLLLLMSCKKDKTDEPIDLSKNYGYENWAGKDGLIKSNIVFPAQLIPEFKLSLTVGSHGQSFFYEVPLYENDIIKNGRLQIGVFPNIEAAQLGLVNYIDDMTTPFKPPYLTNEDFKAGDVAFGKIYDGILKMTFVRNNVLVIIDAPTNSSKVISKEIDKSIINAQVWKVGMAPPSFILPN